MRTIVINPPNKPFTNPSYLAEPLDVLLIATIIKEQHPNTIFLDMDAKCMKNNINEYLEEENIIVFVMDYQIPLHTSEATKNIFEIINNVNKKSRVIMIGKSASYYYEKYLHHGIDIIIKYNPEIVINDIISHINDDLFLESVPNIMYKRNDEIIKTESNKTPIDLNKLPIIDRSLCHLDNYMNDIRTMITSRGCINKCQFCSTPTFFGKWTSRNPKHIMKEIKYLINNYHTKKIMFLDDNMTVDKERMYELIKIIKKEKIHCLFGCLASINTFDEKLFQDMYEVGFRFVHFGLESGSPRILDNMHKQMNLDYVRYVIKKVKQIGYRVRNSFILDYPGTTQKDIEKTFALINDIKPHEVRFHYLAYRVGTPVFYQNKSIVTTQYIHSSKPNIKTTLTDTIDDYISKLKDYTIITSNIDWRSLNDKNVNFKVSALTPIKYGMCWYE